jgi:hypothetical protein
MDTVTEAGEQIKAALANERKSQEAARQTAAEIDAQRERDRAAGVAETLPAPEAAPAEQP